jgi:hypothetical protein
MSIASTYPGSRYISLDVDKDEWCGKPPKDIEVICPIKWIEGGSDGKDAVVQSRDIKLKAF